MASSNIFFRVVFPFPVPTFYFSVKSANDSCHIFHVHCHARVKKEAINIPKQYKLTFYYILYRLFSNIVHFSIEKRFQVYGGVRVTIKFQLCVKMTFILNAKI